MNQNSTTTYNAKTDRFTCNNCSSELDGETARIVRKAIVNGQIERNVVEIRCEICGHTHWITSDEIETAENDRVMESVCNNILWAPARRRLAELRKIYRETNVLPAQKVSLENEWNRQYRARFVVVAH